MEVDRRVVSERVISVVLVLGGRLVREGGCWVRGVGVVEGTVASSLSSAFWKAVVSLNL